MHFVHATDIFLFCLFFAMLNESCRWCCHVFLLCSHFSIIEFVSYELLWLIISERIKFYLHMYFVLFLNPRIYWIIRAHLASAQKNETLCICPTCYVRHPISIRFVFFLCYVHFFSADKKVHQILIYRFFPANLYINLEMKFEFLTPFIEWMKWNVSMTRTMYWTCKMFRLWGLMR